MNTCPIPLDALAQITLAHGGGGRMTHRLVSEVFAPIFALDKRALNDGFESEDGIVITTDAHVVKPLVFPGGNIGSLAAHGTCNDLAMCGAAPRSLAVSWILEEGVAVELVREVARSLAAAASLSGASVVAGDTKVVERGTGDGIFLATTGIGRRCLAHAPGPWRLAEGQALIISGDIARHGMAIMSARTDGLGFDSEILSDCGALWPAVRALLDAGIEPAAMRDCTRGGLATVLAEWAQASRCDLVIEEAAIPVAEPVRAACEILGLDPLYVACEGRFVASVPESQAARAVEVLRALPDHPSAAVIGSVRSAPGAAGMALALQPYGSDRILDMLAGEALPRIC